jgi:predicted NAD/FAD-binding protein
MRIAIIGAGSAGLVTAHLLDGMHEVTVFEKAPIVGGHVRTLGRNVPSPATPGLILEAGVVEFEVRNFPKLMALFRSLGCRTRPVVGTTTFWTRDGLHHWTLNALQTQPTDLPTRLRAILDLLRLRVLEERFHWRTDLPEGALDELTLGELLTDNDLDRWFALLMTYAYSIPYERVRNMPAALTIPVLRAFERPQGWVSLEGGAFDYLARILEAFSGTVHTSTEATRVTRQPDGVRVTLASGEELPFDAVVFAAPPDRTLALLADPSPDEWRRFAAWRGNHIHTLVHCDRALYARREVERMTEFDVIETGRRTGGYNCFLNPLCGIGEDEPRAFGLAFGLDGELDPASVIHRQEHHTPDYTAEAYRWRHEVRATNGDRRTYHAGAWLYEGLQEGAVTSAEAVSVLLGGRRIEGS